MFNVLLRPSLPRLRNKFGLVFNNSQRSLLVRSTICTKYDLNNSTLSQGNIIHFFHQIRILNVIKFQFQNK